MSMWAKSMPAPAALFRSFAIHLPESDEDEYIDPEEDMLLFQAVTAQFTPYRNAE